MMVKELRIKGEVFIGLRMKDEDICLCEWEYVQDNTSN